MGNDIHKVGIYDEFFRTINNYVVKQTYNFFNLPPIITVLTIWGLSPEK